MFISGIMGDGEGGSCGEWVELTGVQYKVSNQIMVQNQSILRLKEMLKENR